MTLPFSLPRAGAWTDAVAQPLLRWLSANEPAVRSWIAGHRRERLGPAAIADLARRQAEQRSARIGFVVGFADFFGPAGFAAATTGDLVAAARICIEMGQRIAAANGYDIADENVQVEILEAMASHPDDGALADDRETAARRAAARYVQHAVHRAVGLFMRRLMRSWSRRLLLSWVPLVGSVVNMKSNRQLMRDMGERLVRRFPPVNG